jgi:hypothetical protein
MPKSNRSADEASKPEHSSDEQSIQGERPPNGGVQKRKPRYDPFVLDKVFTNPRSVFTHCAPRLAALQADAVFVLDTNALLKPFHLGEGQAEDIAKVYRRLKNEARLFVPARSAQEFARHRPNMLKRMYEDLHNRLSHLPQVPSAEKTECPVLEERSVYKTLNAVTSDLRNVRQQYETALKNVMRELTDWSWDDPISRLYSELFTDDVIVSHSVPNDKVLEMLELRVSHKIPPGYKDAGKDDDGIGDLLIWLSIVELAKSKRRHVVFVCNEEKPDWIVRTQNTILGVRPELTYEFHEKTGQFFTIVNYSDFLAVIGAQPSTVERALTVEVDDGLTPHLISDRVLKSLHSLSLLIHSFLNADSDRSPIRSAAFEVQARMYSRIKAQYMPILQSDEALTLLDQLSDALEGIAKYNVKLDFIEARMKESGHSEMRMLKEYCHRFIKLYELLVNWCSTELE